MKAKEIRELTVAELAKQLGDTRREFLNLRIQASNGQLENTARLSQVRRDIARLLTEHGRRQQKEAQVK
jgi:large subunit ribosomal protein L29